MFRFRSFRTRILVATLAVALVPALLGLAGSTLLVRELVTTSGTAGPWDAVAESGRALFEEVREAAPGDPEVAAAVERHRDALSESARLSRLYSYVGERVLGVLPLVALLLGLLVVGLAVWVSRSVARSFSRPVGELIEWTERIARGEPLPEPREEEGAVVEFRELRSALRGMADELAASRARAVEAERLRTWTEMARRVAHELKNPLTPMRLAARTVATADAPALREAAEVLETEIGRLDEMARTFSRFGRLPEGPASEVDVVEMVEELARRHGSGEVPVTVQAEEGVPPVMAHHDALGRAIRNLLTNAVEASGDGGEGREGAGEGVTVRVRATAGAGVGSGAGDGTGGGDGVEIRIRDRGPGIPPEALERIWEPDFTTKSSGTGLGLPIVLQTIRAHDGAVEARNREEGGAEFVVRLPAADAGTDAGADRDDAGRGGDDAGAGATGGNTG